ncbi:MAG: hypothetical protein COB07_11745 [Sulfurovum sp.]|nr:MAG: hypothetical protein COB07_11745 [Sulfurovum sp.]
MIKKITLASVAAMALLFIPAQAEGNKCGAGMMEKCKVKCKADGKCNKCHKMKMRGHSSALLMHLPSPMKMLMKIENDPKLALTAEQKTKLKAQRDDMMPKMMKFKEEIKALSKEIKEACKKSETVAQQKARVEKLGQLKTEATLFKLTCIDGVKAILSKEQKDYMKALRKAKMAQMKERCKVK